MSEVKKISPVGNIYGWEESQFGEFVLSQDYDDLAEEAQALREEVAELRARVVVPERKLLNAGVPGLNRNSGWSTSFPTECYRIPGQGERQWLKN
ncbi:hypothetical protein N1F33_19295 [Pseudomonas aeruginosa]|nr:hypothetical protein [Pseudomonas aeruginosa]MCS8109561.1 hypothetical protein [Pseudomonas aeruginosa]MCS8762531.1 hypothetical protein [Pseudomonas aeruginosa]MCS8929576.1 hypothetical protein [Pseudomonas aeruginosa]